MSIAYGGIVAFFFRGANLVVALFTLAITANELGADGRGTFVLGATAIGIVAAMTGGLTASTAYQVSNQKREPGLVLVNGGAIAVGLGTLAVATGLAGAQLLSGEPAAVALAVGASSAAVILTSVIAGVYLGNGAIVRYNIALVLPPLLSFVAILVVVVGLDQPTPEAALGAFAVGQWIALPLLLILGAGPMLRDIRLEGRLVGIMLRFSLLAGLSSAVSYLNYRADAFMVEHFEGTGGVGIYSIAVYIGESVWQFSGSLALATYARVAGADEEEAVLLTTRVMRHTLVILSVVCLVLFALADVLVGILKPEYASAATALRILLPGALLYGLAAAFSGFYTYQRGMPWAAAVVAGSGLVIDIGLDLFLIPAMGVNGAALASTIAYSAAILGALAVFMYDTKVGPTTVFRFGRADIDDYRSLFGRLRAAVTSR